MPDLPGGEGLLAIVADRNGEAGDRLPRAAAFIAAPDIAWKDGGGRGRFGETVDRLNRRMRKQGF